MNTFENFNNGKLLLPNKEVKFDELKWSQHPTFKGVALKHLITAKDTNGEFSYHLVRIDPNCEIGNHIHATQLETHEVIEGYGICSNDGEKLDYNPGTISIIPAKINHLVKAGDKGLLLFAKFFPALC
ncbi:MAG: cupin domain-containing protein [Bacteroidales bacterium]|nr:cupin domain-containing protein [Bacteroidales bacterium]